MIKLKNDFLDIVAVIVRQISEEGGVGIRDRYIIEGLLDEGYDMIEIDDALSWLETLSERGEGLDGLEFWPGFYGVRVPSRGERETMTADAFAYLSRLNFAGFVEDSTREAIMDKVVELGMPGFGVEQMKTLVGIVLFSRKEMEFEEGTSWLVDRGPGTLLN